MTWARDVQSVVGVCNLEIFGIVLVLLVYETVKEGVLAPCMRMLMPVRREWRGIPVQFLMQQLGIFYILILILLVILLLRRTSVFRSRQACTHSLGAHALKLVQAKALGHQALL